MRVHACEPLSEIMIYVAYVSPALFESRMACRGRLSIDRKRLLSSLIIAVPWHTECKRYVTLRNMVAHSDIQQCVRAPSLTATNVSNACRQGENTDLIDLLTNFHEFSIGYVQHRRTRQYKEEHLGGVNMVV